MDNRSIDKYDLRLRRKFLDESNLSTEEINSYLESLEDQASNIEEVIIEEENKSEE